MEVNKRDVAIRKWVERNRSDILTLIEMLDHRGEKDATKGWMAIAFEAGRQFQIENPHLELNNPDVYIT